MLFVLHQIVDRMDNMLQLRTAYGSGPLEEFNVSFWTPWCRNRKIKRVSGRDIPLSSQRSWFYHHYIIRNPRSPDYEDATTAVPSFGTASSPAYGQ